MGVFFVHIPFMVNRIFNATPTERLQQHPLLFTTNRTDRTFFVWRLNSARPPHLGHSTILLRSESGQSFTLWQQLTIEITRRDHSIITCSCQTYVGVILRAHPVRGESHIQRKANREVATSPSLTWLRHDKYGKNWFKICWRRILAVFAWKNYKIQEE